MLPRYLAPLFAALILVATLTVAGCQEPGTRAHYVEQQDNFITATQALISARHAGEFTQEEWEEDVLPFINLGDALLDDYDRATADGETTVHIREGLAYVLRQLRPLIVRVDNQLE